MKINAIWATLLTTLVLASVFLVSTLVTATVALVVHLESRQDNTATSNLGTIVFDGTSYSLPRNIVKPGTMPYPVQYSPASGYEFVRWETSGGVSVADAYESSTMATVMGNGTLRAIYKLTPPPTHDVNLQSRQDDGSTSNLGTIVFDGSTYHLPTAAVKPSGTYPTNYNPASGYKFVRWETSGGITVADSNSQSTSAKVTGGGTLRAIYTPSPNVTVWISPMISTGQTFKVDIMVFASLGQTPIGAPACIYAWRAEVHFDPTVMAAHSLDDGSFLSSGGPVFWFEKSINNTTGVIELNQTLVGDVPGVNGTGVLATVTFGVIKPENSTINLENLGFYDRLGVTAPSCVDIDGYFVPSHDLMVKSVIIAGLTIPQLLPGTYLQLYPGCNITAIISNVGNYNETVNATACFYDNISTTPKNRLPGLGAHATGLPPETDDRIDFILPFEPDLGNLTPYVNYTLTVEVSPVPGETILGDNLYTCGLVMVVMTGDVNCDKKVDIVDVVIVAKAFGSKPGDPNWNPIADVATPFGKIDIVDVVVVAKEYGKKTA